MILSFSNESNHERPRSHLKYKPFANRSFSVGYEYFYVLVLFLVLFYVSIAMLMVYLKVRSVEKNAEKYSFARFTSSQKKNMKMSRRVMLQGVLYSGILILLCICFVMRLEMEVAANGMII